MNINQETINSIQEERTRQHAKFGLDPIATDIESAIVMGEEFGEICRAICQGKDKTEIQKEVKELAAVCIAYLDGDLHFGNKP